MKFIIAANRHLLALIIAAALFCAASCDFLSGGGDSSNSAALFGAGGGVSITSLQMGKAQLELKVGAMDYIAVNVTPKSEQKNIRLSWSYDKEIIECDTSSGWGVTLKGLKEGQTSLRCSYGGFDATCIVTVSGYEQGYEATVEPYIYSNSTILQTSPGVTEKVFVSLYGGDAGDIDGYTWTIDNPSVAGIQPTGQYCLITAKDTGYARIKVTHTKASYPYYMGIYVFDDITKITYITTKDNILTMNKDDDEKTITVSLMNGKTASSDSGFSWTIVSSDSTQAPVSLQYNGNAAVVKPLNSGSCTIRVTHPDATYPLDILCRVITVVKNVYIEPNLTVVTLDGQTEQTVSCELKNINQSEYSIDDYVFSLETYTAADIVSSVGNQVILKGKANGSEKLIITHPKAAYSREVLLIVTGQLTDAVDASMFITTSQNYIRTKVGAEPTSLLVSLKGGEDGDENNFLWTVKQTPKDGTSDVINLETPNGTVNSMLSFKAANRFTYGNAVISPVSEGTAVITVTHPKIVYPTEILVKVLNKDAILEAPLYFTGSGIIKVLNGDSCDYEVQLRGSNKSAGDDAGISWKVDDNRLSVSGSGNQAHLTAPSQGTGQTISHLVASHNKAEADKSVLVLTADTQEELDKMKALYADKLYYNFEVGNEVSIDCLCVGFDYDYDWSRFKWEVSDPSLVSVEKSASSPRACKVLGLKSGTARFVASVEDDGNTYSCEFTLTVYPKGAMATDPEVYFTTAQNVVILSGVGKSAKVSVQAINLKAAKYSQIQWKNSDSSVVSVAANGTSANVTALAEGEAVLTVTHEESQNELKIYVRVGSEYVIPNAKPVVYIVAQDVLTMLRGDGNMLLEATLANYDGVIKTGFSFTIDDESVAKITAQTDDGKAYVKPVASGQAQITIKHTATEIDKKVLVIVGNSAEELAGITYLTTSSNVIAIGEGNTKNVSVQVQNAESAVLDGYSWESTAPEYVNITSTTAAPTAVLQGNSIGTSIIRVKNKVCKYPLEIIAQCVDPIAAAGNPYIQLSSSVMTVSVGNAYNTVSAELVGGTESDKSNFDWVSNDSKIAVVFGQNEIGKIKAVGTGTTYITVTHPKAHYAAQLLVVCDEPKKNNCYISVPSSVINMKPTDSSQTITAALINGEDNDKYNFNWQMDVYDIIDMTYTANVCQITPKQTGTTTITISHPKADYDQQVIVKVEQYSSFAFPNESYTMTQGDVQFLAMQVPTTNVATHVEYSTDNASICTINGTKTTAHLTGVGSGTCTVKAKLVASSSGVEQASAEMMVYVKPKAVDAVYITATSTISTVNKGKSSSLTAILSGTGVIASDQYNLKWSTNDTDIIQITGIGSDGTVRGQTVYITALKAGEAVVTCSHEKAASDLKFLVVVPGAKEKIISLDKNYMTLIKGKSAPPLKATIENAESSADYYDITWLVENVGDNEICRVMGSGQTVNIQPINVGSATIIAQLPDSPIAAKCDVIVTANKNLQFESTGVTVNPKHTRTVKYIVSPPTSRISWQYAQDKDFFEYRDLGADSVTGEGYVEIIGLMEGSGQLSAVTDEGAKAKMTVKVSWDYMFSLTGKTALSCAPDEPQDVTYKVSPKDADITVESTELGTVFDYITTDNGDGTGTIRIIPLTESGSEFSIRIKATNPKLDNEEIGSKDIKAKFAYKDINIDIGYITKVGVFSHWENDSESLAIGDGETVTLKAATREKNADVEITSITFNKKKDRDMEIFDQNCAGAEATFSIKNGDDIILNEYLLRKVMAPQNANWKNKYVWRTDHDAKYNDGYIYSLPLFCLVEKENWGAVYGQYYATGGSYQETIYEYVEDYASRGLRLTEFDFKNCAWLYCPGTPADGWDTLSSVTYEDFETGRKRHGSLQMAGNIGYGQFTSDNMFVKEHVMTDHVQYEVVPTLDQTLLDSSGFKGTIKVNYTHRGANKFKEFNVYTEDRNCNIYGN